MADGITVECVSCKTRKTLSFEEARALTDQPCCDKCGMPAVAVSAAVTNKQPRKRRPIR